MTRLNKGDFIRQNSGANITTYGKLLEKYKNGAWKAIVHYEKEGSPARGQAAIKSTKGWYPEPVRIDRQDVPAKILEKIEVKEQNL